MNRSRLESPSCDFNVDSFLETSQVNSSVKDFLSAMLEYRPSQPLHFAADFFKALADAEDERIDAQLSIAAIANQSGRKKKDTASASSLASSASSIAKEVAAATSAGVRSLSTLQYMTLRLEMQRFSLSSDHTDPRLRELLADAFDALSSPASGFPPPPPSSSATSSSQPLAPPGTPQSKSASLDDCVHLLRRLAGDLDVPLRACEQLVSELSSECPYSRVSFLQFLGAGRSLAMLPKFLAEAARLCARLNGRPSPSRPVGNGGAYYNTAGGAQASKRGGVSGGEGEVDVEEVIGALPKHRGAVEWNDRDFGGEEEDAGGSSDLDVAPGLRESLILMLGLMRGGGEGSSNQQINVYDLINAAVSGKSSSNKK
jgi:hypothetical protein